MLGLILALFYVAWNVVAGDMEAHIAVANTFGFLWYWHLTWTVVLGLIVGLVFLVGLLMTKADATTGVMAMFLITPILLVVNALRQCLFLGAVATLTKASMGAEGVLPANQWNTTFLIIGGIMYLFAILMQKSSVKLSKD